MLNNSQRPAWHATTILCVRDNQQVIIIGDGQVSLGHTIVKSTANKIRTLANNSIIAGFAGATADAFTLFKLLLRKLEKYSNNLIRSSVELKYTLRVTQNAKNSI
jgi:ATP-dependent HslUV protease subunit HslV